MGYMLNRPSVGTLGGGTALDFGFGARGGNTGCILLMVADCGRAYCPDPELDEEFDLSFFLFLI